MLDTTTNNIIRITNIIFSHDFLDLFLTLNDNKNRVDHKTGRLPKNFWEDVAEAMNGLGNDNNTALKVVIKEEDQHCDEIKSMNLQQFDMMTASTIRKKVFHLLKVRKEMQKNMTQSREHNSNPYNFVEVAMKNVGATGLTELGCYYFFKRCDDNPQVDVFFTDKLDDNLKGNTDTMSMIDSKETRSSEKKRAYAAMADISKTAKSIADAMKETNRLAQETANEMKEKNRLMKQSQLISLAQHLGKQEILEQMLLSFASSSDD